MGRATDAVMGGQVVTDDYEYKARIALRRINQLQAENVMLVNAIQNAQRLIAESKYDEADLLMRDVIWRLLESEADSVMSKK
jgi:hypothetical protein